MSIDLNVYEGAAYDLLPGSMLFAAKKCEPTADNGGYVPTSGVLVTGPQVGDQSAVCAFTWANGAVRTLAALQVRRRDNAAGQRAKAWLYPYSSGSVEKASG